MTALMDLTGQTYGRLTVERRAENSKAGGARWCCRCSCGATLIVEAIKMRTGNTLSCGCLRRETTSAIGRRAFRHGGKVGGKESKEYGPWRAMHRRCYDPDNTSYQWYGAKGIKVCRRWHKYENFLADMGRRPPGMTLDRRDNTKDYSKSNCRWASHTDQQRNRSSNRHLTYKGETLVMKAWAERYGVNYVTFKWRIYQGWPMERALGLQP